MDRLIDRLAVIRLDKLTDRQAAERQPVEQTDGHTDNYFIQISKSHFLTGKQDDIWTDRHTYRKTDRHMDRQIDRWLDRITNILTDRQKIGLTYIQMDTHTHRQLFHSNQYHFYLTGKQEGIWTG
jgi:hypothetical protein